MLNFYLNSDVPYKRLLLFCFVVKEEEEEEVEQNGILEMTERDKVKERERRTRLVIVATTYDSIINNIP